MMGYSKNKQKEIIKMLCGFRKAFPNSKADSDTMLIYSYALMDMEVGLIYAAMIKILHTSKFFPSVAEIRSTAEQMLNFSRNTTLPTAGEAWEEVQQQVRKVGPYSSQPWEFSCPEVEKAARQFGLMELCRLQETEVNTARAQFMRIYDRQHEKLKELREMEAVMETLPPERKEQFLFVVKTITGTTTASTEVPQKLPARKNSPGKVLPMKIKSMTK